jgi:hypothetical protein
LGVVISVAPAVEALGGPAGVVFRPVPELSPLQFWVARADGDEREHVRHFVDEAVAALRNQAPPAGSA